VLGVGFGWLVVRVRLRIMKRFMPSDGRVFVRKCESHKL
jgi:hypothetical protein